MNLLKRIFRNEDKEKIALLETLIEIGILALTAGKSPEFQRQMRKQVEEHLKNKLNDSKN
jgi:hypothetical protein